MWQKYDVSLNNIINECLNQFFLIRDLSACRTYAVKSVVSIVSLKLINHIKSMRIIYCKYKIIQNNK